MGFLSRTPPGEGSRSGGVMSRSKPAPLRSLVALCLVAGLGASLSGSAAAAPHRDRSASLPGAAHGVRPGPAILYAKPPRAPQLENRGPWHAKPILVSGTDAYRGGGG